MEGGLCYFHANPDKAAESGRTGGRRRLHTFEQTTEQIAPPESAADVRRMLAEVMADIRAGEMDPKLGTTLGYVGTALLRALEIADFEQRLERLEQANTNESTPQEAGAVKESAEKSEETLKCIPDPP